MNLVRRRTNVRQHRRRTKNSVADVRMHERALKARRELGRIPLKDLRYKQAKRIFPRLNPYADSDGDGVPNKRDCRPFDAARQDDDIQDLLDSIAQEERQEEERLQRLREIEQRAQTQMEEEEKVRNWGLAHNRKVRNKAFLNDEGFEDVNDAEERYWKPRGVFD